jgi:hypothetical protein
MKNPPPRGSGRWVSRRGEPQNRTSTRGGTRPLPFVPRNTLGRKRWKMLKAIPTKYRGIQMRSRLEAKWACMFDLLGWKWEYEPIDFNGWIPDFVIKGHSRPILVECKPIFTFDESLGADILRAAGVVYKDSDDEDEADRFAAYEFLVCGAGLLENCFRDPSIGWLWEGCWSPCAVPELHGRPKRFGLCHDLMSYADRVHNGVEGGHLPCPPDLVAMWKRAGNKTQWKAPK